MKDGESIENAIVIKAQDYISGVLEEHNYIAQLCKDSNIGIKAIKQNFIIENGKKYDVFILKMDDSSERMICFDITSFFKAIKIGQ